MQRNRKCGPFTLLKGLSREIGLTFRDNLSINKIRGLFGTKRQAKQLLSLIIYKAL
jgi:hypothetical protein